MTTALINGNIYTLDQDNSIISALAIDKNLIIKTGTTQDILDLDIAFDLIIDLQGKTVLPGFVDSHTHLGQIALESLWVNLQETKTPEEIFEQLNGRIDQTQAGNWVVGVNYDDSFWPKGTSIFKEDLDDLSMDHPIFLRRICGHHAVVNTSALELIDSSWKYVNRETGLLLEDAVLGFMKIIKPSIDLRKKGTYHMMDRVHTLGITSVREIVNNQSVKVYRELDDQLELKLRIYGYIIVDDLEEHLKVYPRGKYSGTNFHVIGLKILLDGSLGARTAALKEPYDDDRYNNGKLLYSDSELISIFKKSKSLELSLMVHSIGDRTLEQFIKIYREVFTDQIPENPWGHTVEHVEVLDSDLINELNSTGLWVSAQPNFAGRWSLPGGMNEQRLGSERIQLCNPYRTLMENDIPVIFGSDCMPVGPLFGIRSAIFHPETAQRLTPKQAIYAYTQNWYRLTKNNKFGKITPCSVADLAILESDPFIANEQQFDEMKVVGTIFDGEIIFNDGMSENL